MMQGLSRMATSTRLQIKNWSEGYYDSDEWQAKRVAVIARDPVCTAQIVCDGAPSVQAHHLTYKHFRREPLFELAGVCVACHAEITRMDREKRKRK